MEKLTMGEKDCLRRLELIQEDIAGMSVEELSATVHYSHATINRLVKKLGYKNIKSYKLHQIKNMKISFASEEKYLKKLHELLECTFEEQFQIICTLIKEANQIHVVGLDTSNSPAITLFRGFAMHEYNVDLYSSGGLFHAYASESSLSGDLVFICSYSCSDYYLINGIKSLRNTALDIKVVLITTLVSSEVFDYCDIVLTSQTFDYDNLYRASTPITIIAYKLLRYLEKES